MRHRIPPLLPALLLLPAASQAGPLAVHEWDARPADPRPYLGRIPHGSAARLVARLPGPVASASFLWQTNGMGAAWWEAPAECASNAVSVLWTPAMDSGAAVHRAFFRVAQPEGPDYGAFATLAMLDSPGFAPNALPLPVERLDFAAVAWTNAPWALPEDIPAQWPASAITNAPWLTAYTETDPTVPDWAKQPNPPTIEETDPVFTAWAATNTADLSAYATTGLVHAMHPDFEEYASATYTRVAADAVAAAIVAEPRGDAVATVGRTSGYALRAVRSTAVPGGMDDEADVDGTWALVAPTDAATLSSNVLHATSRPGPATVEFRPGDGSSPLRAAVSMPGDAVRTATVWPAAETDGAWRVTAFDPALYAEAAVVTTRLGSATYICTNHPASASIAPAWYAPRPPGHGGGLVGLAPHYALSSTHCGEYGPCDWPGGGSSGRGTSIATFGDLRLLRMPSEIPAASRARLLRSSTLASLSESLLFRALCFAHTQHGGCAPCLVDPLPSRADLAGLAWDAGWTFVGPRDEWRNATWAHLRPLSHAPHINDSGHPVFVIKGTNSIPIPIGLFHTVAGSGECLLSDALLDQIDAAIRRDSGGAESLTYLSAEDIQ